MGPTWVSISGGISRTGWTAGRCGSLNGFTISRVEKDMERRGSTSWKDVSTPGVPFFFYTTTARERHVKIAEAVISPEPGDLHHAILKDCDVFKDG
jgi:hypothetical protein